MRFYTSDTHFSHRNIVKFQPNRGRDDVHDMNQDIIDSWNETVDDGDIVFHLGDVAMGPVEEWNNSLFALNGAYKALVVGNHEKIFKGNKPNYQAKHADLYNQWFNEISENIVGHELFDGTIVNMSHFPYTGDHFDGDRYTEYRLPDDGRILLHGHTHSTEVISHSASGTLQIHVGWDSWGRPVSEQDIVNIIAQHS